MCITIQHIHLVPKIFSTALKTKIKMT
jgi:hypothetical protein